ncbi:MAG TPA: hypothetical protein VFS69_06785, partial [Sphingomicrobium sp.]|nr:hypothetical protein [Sphingomicrobium sp.]
MRARSHLRVASDGDELRFGPRGELRETFATGGRIHIDRWLPYLILYRGEGESIGRRVAVNSAAYLIWSPEDDDEAESALQLVVDRLRQELGSVLLIELTDTPAEPKREDSPKLPAIEVD